MSFSPQVKGDVDNGLCFQVEVENVTGLISLKR